MKQHQLEHLWDDPWQISSDEVASCRTHLYGSLAVLHLRLGEIDNALACATRFVEYQPDHPYSLIVLAAVHTYAGHLDEGRELLAQVCERFPDKATAYQEFIAVAKQTWSIKQPK